MVPSKRSRKNQDLNGTNITPIIRKKGCEDEHYAYYYKKPDGKMVFLSKDRAESIEAAIDLNRVFRDSASIVDRITNAQRKPTVPLDNINNLIDEFEREFIPEKKYSRKTLEGKLLLLRKHREVFGDESTSEITTRTIVLFLNTLSTDPYIKHRVILKDLFTFAIHQGYRETNPVLVTMAKAAPKRKRKKHTLEGWNMIRVHAPEWLQRAMDIALLSLQRRSDLVSIHRNQVDLNQGTIKILQEKTRNYKKPVYIEITMGNELSDAVKRCYKTGIPCPFLIHYKPLKMSRADQDAKEHPFSVTSSHLSKTFSKVRDECGAYDHIPKGIRPSFHDARGLGAYLYEKAGFPSEYIQSLTGHASKEMLDHYIEGHEAPVPVRVSAELSVNSTNIQNNK